MGDVKFLLLKKYLISEKTFIIICIPKNVFNENRNDFVRKFLIVKLQLTKKGPGLCLSVELFDYFQNFNFWKHIHRIYR